jgi:hypothetical protein
MVRAAGDGDEDADLIARIAWWDANLGRRLEFRREAAAAKRVRGGRESWAAILENGYLDRRFRAGRGTLAS